MGAMGAKGVKAASWPAGRLHLNLKKYTSKSPVKRDDGHYHNKEIHTIKEPQIYAFVLW